MKIVKKTKGFILDTLFPIHCISCDQEGFFICETCFSKIELLDFQVCPQCEKLITEKGAPCEFCKKNQPPLNNLVAATKYTANNLSRLVHLYKYSFATDLRVPLGKLLARIILKNNLPLPDLIVPVPLHRRRLRWRGFNQSELLAKYIADNLTPGFSIPVFSDLIVRQKYTPPQMKIGKYADRRENMREAFAINKKTAGSLAGKRILLIDDICTTGATLSECAKVLKQGGAKRVMAAVIARQEFEK